MKVPSGILQYLVLGVPSWRISSLSGTRDLIEVRWNDVDVALHCMRRKQFLIENDEWQGAKNRYHSAERGETIKS